MKILDDIYLVGGGNFGLSHPSDGNLYLVNCQDHLLMIDCGSGIKGSIILDNIEKDGFEPQKIELIINTHTGWDHARGNRYFKDATGCKIAVHESGVEVLEKKLWPHLHLTQRGIPSHPVKVDRSLRDGDVVSLGKYNFHILHTPGHTADSICVSVNVEGKKVLFSGDTILAEALIGEFGATVDFNSYMQSIEKIAGLNVDVLLPGHKVFVLSRANVHVDTCLENFKRKWSGYVIGPTPFYPSWWMNTFPELLQDCDER